MFKTVDKLAPEEINNLFMKQYEIHNHGTRSVELLINLDWLSVRNILAYKLGVSCLKLLTS